MGYRTPVISWEFIFKLILWTSFVLFYNSNYTMSSGFMLSIFLIVVPSITLVQALYFRNIPLLILYFFIIQNCYPPISYFVLGLDINSINQLQSIESVYRFTLLMYLFIVSLFTFQKVGPFILSDYVLFGKKIYLGYKICLSISIIIFVFGRTGSTILETGGYGETLETMNSSFIWEYFLAFIACAYLFSETDKQKKILLVLTICYCIKNLLFGGRIQTVMALCFWVIMYLQYRFSFKMILMMIVTGYFFMTFMSDLRSGTLFELHNTNKEVKTYGVGNNHQVFYSGLRMMYIVDHGLIPLEIRAKSLLTFCAAAIVPFKYLPQYANLTWYLSTKYVHGGGGLAPSYFYVWFSWFGAFLLGFWIAKTSSWLNKPDISIFKFLYALFVVICVPRWLAYYPIQLIKFTIIVPVIYKLLYNFLNTSKNEKYNCLRWFR